MLANSIVIKTFWQLQLKKFTPHLPPVLFFSFIQIIMNCCLSCVKLRQKRNEKKKYIYKVWAITVDERKLYHLLSRQ